MDEGKIGGRVNRMYLIVARYLMRKLFMIQNSSCVQDRMNEDEY